MAQICHTWGTWGKVSYPPQGSQLCPVHGSAKSEPVGWSDSKPHQGKRLLGTGSATDVLGEIPDKF